MLTSGELLCNTLRELALNPDPLVNHFTHLTQLHRHVCSDWHQQLTLTVFTTLFKNKCKANQQSSNSKESDSYITT